MRKFALLFFTSIACYANEQQLSVTSPNRNVQLNVVVNNAVNYALSYKNKPAILSSSLGFKFKEPAVELKSFTLLQVDSSLLDQAWKPVWGEYSSIRDLHKELRLKLQDKASGIL